MRHQLLKNDQRILCETENLVFITIQLHPPQILQSRFTSIKLFFLYNSSCFISTLCSHDPPSPCLLLGKSITGAQFYLVWRLKGGPQIIQLWWVSLRGSLVLYSSKIWYFFFFFIWQSCKQDLHPPSFTACARFPLLISRQQKTSDIKRRGGGLQLSTV